ncbi:MULTISPECIES: GNAT family N-acetyltransferase [unclassified Streptomyces]|uniref:GNAT family N-acetyltransferase n=1 Tax=unclassified Streptomyces TaxID=2593676 RepID=UPI00278C10AB|nr:MULTISPECIES: GNAT family N-acetyltransferase [unclassified Streptomyces]
MPFEIDPVIPAGALSSAPQPTLRTPDGELALRAPESTDVPAVRAAFRDPDIRYWHARSMESDDEARAWIADAREGWLKESSGQWLVTRAADGEPLGRIALKDINPLDGCAEIAYWVLPTARGTGVAPRAVTALTEWATGLGFHRLDLLHSTRNEPSCRVALKSGYPLEGTRRSFALHTDGWHDMHVHTRINS